MGAEESDRRVPDSQRPDAGVEAPEQLHFPSRGIERTVIDSCTHVDGSSELGENFSLQADIGMKPEISFPQLTARQELMTSPMSQQELKVKLRSE